MILTLSMFPGLVDHPFVAEAACIGKSHEVKGQAVIAFVSLKEGYEIKDGFNYPMMRASRGVSPEEFDVNFVLPK